MTTDLETYGKSRKRPAVAGSLWRQPPGKGSAPAAGDVSPAIAAALPGLLEQQALERDGWKRTMGATIALLRSAQRRMDEAEAVISHQAGRIRALEQLATSDELTGLMNRRGFFQAFEAELDRCNRGLVSGGLLVLIDLDNFKAVNDGYGHQVGDSCLRLVARTLTMEIREMDAAGRIGGDEFVLLLSSTTKKKAVSRIQQFAWRLNNLALAWHGDVIPVRASLGLREYGRGDKPEIIFNAADIAMYGNKERRKKKRSSQSA